jgi:hypothetical protein
LFLRKHESAQYHVEILLRDLRTSEFPVLFDGRRGPKFLPRSFLESASDEASMSLRETRNKRRKPDSDQPPLNEEPEEGEEADASSASQTDNNTTPKRHILHHHRSAHQHESAPSTSSNVQLKSKKLPDSSKKVSGSLLSSFRQQFLQVSFSLPIFHYVRFGVFVVESFG